MTYHPVIRECGKIFTIEVQMDIQPEDIRALQEYIERGTEYALVYMTVTPVIIPAKLFDDFLEMIGFELDVQTPSYSVYVKNVNLRLLEWGINDLNEYLVTSIPKIVEELDRVESGNFFNEPLT